MPRPIWVLWVGMSFCCFFHVKRTRANMQKRKFYLLLLFSSVLMSLSTIFQLYRDGVWMWRGAQCSLKECYLTDISHLRHTTWHSTRLHYTDTGPTSSAFSMLSANKRAANTILKVFGITRPGIEPTTSRRQAGRSSNWATAPVGSKIIGLLI